jgi:hypothetical protein
MLILDYRALIHLGLGGVAAVHVEESIEDDTGIVPPHLREASNLIMDGNIGLRHEGQCSLGCGAQLAGCGQGTAGGRRHRGPQNVTALHHAR